MRDSVGFQLDSANNGAHLKVETVGDVTQLRIDDDLNGSYEYSFNSTGTVTSLGLAFGSGVGYGAWSSGTADNWELNGGCDGCISPPLAITGATAGGTATATVNCATPGGLVILGYSLTGGGPLYVNAGCPIPTVCMTPPITEINLVANAAGTASFTTGISAGATGVNVWAQAFDQASCTLSNGVQATL